MPEPPCDGIGNVFVACGGVGQPEGVLTGMVVRQLGQGRGKVGNADEGLGRDGPDELLAAEGGVLFSAADDWGATGAT